VPLGRKSVERLALCPPALIRLFTDVARDIDAGALAPLVLDIAITCTFRDKEEQDAAYLARPQRSKKPWPTSGHNKLPPLAVDCVPYPERWAEWEQRPAPLWALQGFIRARASSMGIRLKPAITWDAPHYEMAEVIG
jgi:hypothetical protein